jgi:cobalt-zinc-cadmium efflux system outer membrane protein
MKSYGRMMSLAILLSAHAAWAQTQRISYARAIDLAEHASATMAVARAEEEVIGADVGIAGIYPNPTLIGGTNTQAAKASVGLSVPLNILGQRGAAVRASRAEVSAAQIATQAMQSDARSAAAHAFVELWLAERTAKARADAEQLAARVDDAVATRVQVGSVPQAEGVRSRALRLKAHADAVEAAQLVAAAAANLGRWIGVLDGSQLRADGDPVVPGDTPALGGLLEQVAQSPAVLHERAAAEAARARASRERALVRPLLTLEVGVDAYDPTLPATNYRAQLGMDLPLFTRRGPYIEREERSATAADLRARYQVSLASADLVVAYRTFEAASARRDTLEQAGLPASRSAARATEESYSLGRASLEALLDADRNLLDTELALLEAQAARANAWIDVQHAMGVR